MWGVRKGAIFIHIIYIYHPLLFIQKWMNISSANKDGEKEAKDY
jgi:hypothetical protein